MKKARAHIQAVWLECPYCGSDEVVDADDGTMTINWCGNTERCRCLDCEKISIMPTTAR